MVHMSIFITYIVGRKLIINFLLYERIELAYKKKSYFKI